MLLPAQINGNEQALLFCAKEQKKFRTLKWRTVSQC